MKINTNNIDPKYWERVLQRYKLSEEQLELVPRTEVEDEEPDEVNEEPEEKEETSEELKRSAHRVTNSNPDFAFLRTKFDNEAQFMAGHQIKTIKVMKRRTGDWATSDQEVQKLIDSAFPRWKDVRVKRFRKAAARCVRVIYLYYRVRMPRKMVAKEMGLQENTVNKILANINRVRKELKSNTRVKPPMVEVSGA